MRNRSVLLILLLIIVHPLIYGQVELACSPTDITAYQGEKILLDIKVKNSTDRNLNPLQYSLSYHLFDMNGKIRGVKFVSHKETPSYITGIENWFARFKNRDVAEGVVLGPDGVDAVSRATITSQAVVDIVNQAGKKAASELLGIKVKSSPATTTPVPILPMVLLIIVTAAFIPVYYSRNVWLRNTYLVFIVVATGFYLNIPLTIQDLGNISLGLLPPLLHVNWYVLIILVLVLMIFLGPVYCGYLCPFGALQELLSCIVPQQPVKPETGKKLRFVKYVVLFAALSYFSLSGDKAGLHFTPQQFFFTLNFSGWKLFLVILVFAGGLFYWRFWCRYLCPAGAFFSLFNKVFILKSKSPRRYFNNCPYQITDSDDIDCLRCNRCRVNEKEK